MVTKLKRVTTALAKVPKEPCPLGMSSPRYFIQNMSFVSRTYNCDHTAVAMSTELRSE